MISIAIMAGLALALGIVLGFASVRFRVQENPLVDNIDGILPQTQCGQCGFPGCRPYAEAIANGEADINLCPPGGEDGIHRLAELLGVDFKPFGDAAKPKDKAVAVIDEQLCIGCTLCIKTCPVDAIIGSAKHVHTILASGCTGCELCLEPCPVECIRMEPVRESLSTWKWQYPVFEIKALPADEAARMGV